MSINNKRSYTEYTVTTATTDFVIGFDDYDDITKDTIVVTVNGVLAESQGYAVMRKNAQVITITPAVQSGTVRLERVTDIDESFHQFTAGALFSAKSVDENFEQVRHSQQEVRDGFEFLEFNTNGVISDAKAATDRANAAAELVEGTDVHELQQDVVALDNSKLSKVASFGSKTTDVLYRLGTNYESRAVTPETANWTPQQGGWNLGIVKKTEARTWYHDYRPTIADGAAFDTDGCNFFMGAGAGNFTMKPDVNAIGDYKLHTSHNYAVGLQALGKLTTGYKNTAFGTNCGRALTEGFYNTATGRDALHNCTIGHSNTMTGMTCGYGVVSGNYNSYYGTQAGYNNKLGSGNTIMGARAGNDMVEGDNNTFVGYQSARGQLGGTRNTIIGYQSENCGITTASYNTVIGSMVAGLDDVGFQTVLADGNGNISYLNNPSGTKAAKHDVIGRDTTNINLLASDAQQTTGTTVRVMNTSNANSFAQVVLQSRIGQGLSRLVAWGSQTARLSIVNNNVEALRVEGDASVNFRTSNASTPVLATNGMMGFQLVSNTQLKVNVKGTDGVIRSATLTLS